jgi:flagellar hook-associated protein 2
MALKAGSGVDINDLATTLAEAESMPSIASVTDKKEAATLSISGLAVLKSAVTAVKVSFDGLQDKDTLLDKTVLSQSSDRVEAVMVSQTGAKAGTHKVQVNQLAAAEQSVIKRFNGSGSDTADFTSLTQQLNGGSAINFSIVVNGSTTNLTGTVDTPQGIIDAVNANTEATGVSARALNITGSGTSFRILLEGKTGASNSFALTGHQTANTNNQLSVTESRAALNLSVKVNGLNNVLRDNNSPTDLIDGVQLTFKEASATSTNIVISENTAALESRINTLIGSYNAFINITDYVTGEKDPDDEVAGSLMRERTTVNMVKSKLRSLLGMTSSTASNGIGTLRDIGIKTNLDGTIGLNNTAFAVAVKTKFSDIRKMLTADSNDQAAAGAAANGLALDASVILNGIVKNPNGTLTTAEANQTNDVTRYEQDLVKLQERMESIRARYLKQFSAMETLVQRSKNTGDYLTGQFKAMESMYSND